MENIPGEFDRLYEHTLSASPHKLTAIKLPNSLNGIGKNQRCDAMVTVV